MVLSPSFVRGISGASDSLGVVFYELLTGDLPLGKFPPPSRKVSVDVRLADIVLRALETRPELRFQTAGEFRTQLAT